MANNAFSVMDMASQYAKDNNMDVSDLFKSPKTETKPAAAPKPEVQPAEEKLVRIESTNSNQTTQWAPSAELIQDLPELQGQQTGVVYSKDEYKESTDDAPLVNMLDDEALHDSMSQLDSMQRQAANIELLKKRHGVSQFKIPEGPYQVRMTAAAGNPDVKMAQAALDEVFEDLVREGPECIIYEHPEEHEAEAENPDVAGDETTTDAAEADPADSAVNIRIDKTHVPELSFTDDELDKIRTSRKIELDIIEGKDIEYASIENADDNLVDIALQAYRRKSNDLEAALPASNYRAVFTGLTYPEVIDLKAASELSGADAEYKKWSIAFGHLKNPSIGDFEEYRWYIDPQTNRRVKLGPNESAPRTLDENTPIRTCSKFEDFLRKTSYLDLEYMLWKVLCATATDKELINIVCKANRRGSICNKSYDWIYNPAELLEKDSVPAVTFDAMEKTMKCASMDDIMAHYNDSMVVKQNTISLPTSGFRAVFGHMSAYDYLTAGMYDRWQELNDIADSNEIPPDYATKTMLYTIVQTVKALLIPGDDGKYKSVSGVDKLIYCMGQMDVVDLSVLGNIADMMISPYSFRFSLRGLRCPHCNTSKDVPIQDIKDLLFILARSLSNVNVILKTR